MMFILVGIESSCKVLLLFSLIIMFAILLDLHLHITAAMVLRAQHLFC